MVGQSEAEDPRSQLAWGLDPLQDSEGHGEG